MPMKRKRFRDGQAADVHSAMFEGVNIESQDMDIGDWMRILNQMKEEMLHSECVSDKSKETLLENNEPTVKTEVQDFSFEYEYPKHECSAEIIPPTVMPEQSDVKILPFEFTNVSVSSPEEFYVGQTVHPTYTKPMVTVNSTKSLPDFQPKTLFYGQIPSPVASEFTPLKAVQPLARFSVTEQNISIALNQHQFGNPQDSFRHHQSHLQTSLQPTSLQMHFSQAFKIDTITEPQAFTKEEAYTNEDRLESKYIHQPIQYIQVTKLPRGAQDFAVSPAQICLYEGSYCAIQIWSFYNDQEHTSEKISVEGTQMTEINKTKSQRRNRKLQALSSNEMIQLKEAFAENNYADKNRCQLLASALNLPSDRIKKWFSYQRSRLRKKEKLAEKQITENKENLCTFSQPLMSDVWLPVLQEDPQVDASLSHVDQSCDAST